LTKLCTLPLLAGENISRDFVVPTVATCIDVVVHCERDRQGRRRVREILTVGSRVEGGVIETSALFQRDAEGDLRLN
ncbi:CpaF family protein, partial [Xanthomonas citri pv. citri]|nr:CpaF family protein [Xanthomonas citri pv. citri]